MPALTDYWRRYRRSTGLNRELITFVLCVLLGMLAVPIGIWVVGNAVLGRYANGGLFALLGDFFNGIAQGDAAFWLVAAGPYVGVWIWRGLRQLRRYGQ